MANDLHPGDIVKTAYGKIEWTVYQVNGNYVQTCRFQPSGRKVYEGGYMNQWLLVRRASQIIVNEKGDKMDTNALYEIKNGETVTYGKYLATNSSGKYVMEVKETGVLLTVDPASVSEVVPYTVNLSNIASAGIKSILIEEGKVKVGDLVVDSGGIWRVSKLDTKQKVATKFVGSRLVTADL